MADLPSLSASQVKKAGQRIRRYMRGEDVPPEQLSAAIEVVDLFRASHQLPLVTANNGLRSMLRTEGCKVEVSQRLKRFPTIVDKLVRLPNLPLSSMQDIGGVRAILNTIDEIRRVEGRVKRNRPPVGYSDYISSPRSSGYRGVHVIVAYGGRQIEIQLRTRVMHAWAITIEGLSSRLGENLKGDGEHAVQALMAAISQAMAREEEGSIVGPDLLSEIARLRADAAPHLQEGH